MLVTLCHDQRAQLCSVKPSSSSWSLAPLLVTPWHPVRVDSDAPWQFPRSISAARDVLCSAVYSFLIERDQGPHRWASSLECDGVEVVALAHGIQSGCASHAFWGTQRCVDALRACAGWRAGRVVFDSHSEWLRRCARGDEVCGLDPAAELTEWTLM